MLGALARLVLRLLGWKVLHLDRLPPRAVVIGYPHTSNWDFPFGLLAMAATGLSARWAGKDTLFAGWRGPLMRALGGIPVNRRERTGFVRRMAEELQSRERIHLVIAPEGTRSLTEGWKSGFYRIAVAAQVPLILGTVDYSRKELGLVTALELSGDEATDLARIGEQYAGRLGKRPQLASPIRLLR